VHVVHLSTVHQATDTRIFHKECRSLVGAGYAVTLIARAEADGCQDGVQIRALPVRKGGRITRMTRSVIDAFLKARASGGDAFHFHDPELLPVGLVLSMLGKKVVYDAHEELSGQIRTKGWIPAALRPVASRVVGAFERVCARAFAAVVVANPLQGAAFPKDKTVAIQNFPMLAEMSSGATSPYSDRDNIVFYVGGLTETRGVRQMAEAVGRCNGHMSVELRLGGTFGPPRLRDDVVSLPGWRYTTYLGQLGRQDIVDELGRARVGLVVVHPVPNYLNNQPVKLFEYMMAGVPVVASDIPNYRQFVSDLGTGLMVDPLDADAIANAILWLLDHPDEAEAMGQRGREAVLTTFNWESEARKLVALYQKILATDTDQPSSRRQ
jgi:glycosyltransferase involved in cell wall biosynthesis